MTMIHGHSLECLELRKYAFLIIYTRDFSKRVLLIQLEVTVIISTNESKYCTNNSGNWYVRNTLSFNK